MASFEGEDIDKYVVVIRRFTGAIDTPLVRGENVQVTIRGKVQAVTIKENQRNGLLTREHVVTIEEIVE